MAETSTFILYLDDFHAGDMLFLQSLARALARRPPALPTVVLHGSAEHAERLLEANGIFRDRERGILPVKNEEEYRIVERAGRQLNQKIVAVLTDAVVASVGVMGDQRRMFVLDEGRVKAAGASWLRTLLDDGVVPVVSGFARDETSGTTGEIPLPDAAIALAQAYGRAQPVAVFFTKTNLPGVMRDGKPVPGLPIDAPSLPASVADLYPLERVLASGAAEILLTNTTRFSDAGGPTGTRINAPASRRAES